MHTHKRSVTHDSLRYINILTYLLTNLQAAMQDSTTSTDRRAGQFAISSDEFLVKFVLINVRPFVSMMLTCTISRLCIVNNKIKN